MASTVGKCLLFLTFVVILGEKSLAGPGSHGVDNGGDISELQAVQIWTQAGEVVSHCLSRGELCGLIEGEKIFLRDFLASEDQKGALEFVASLESWSFSTEQVLGSLITINSLKLYKNKSPITYKSISEIVFHSLFFQYGKNYEEAKALANKISQFWNRETKLQILNVWGQRGLFVWVTSRENVRLFFDLPNGSWELTSLFSGNTPCGGIVTGIPLVSATNISIKSIIIRGIARGNCSDEKSWTSDFQMTLFLTENADEIVLEKSGLRYFNAEF